MVGVNAVAGRGRDLGNRRHKREMKMMDGWSQWATGFVGGWSRKMAAGQVGGWSSWEAGDLKMVGGRR